MHRRIALTPLVGLLTLAFSACSGGGGGGGGGSTPPPPPAITFSHTFPAGDAMAQKGTAWDIIGVTTTLTGQFGSAAGQRYDTLRVDTTFAQDISNALPAPGQSLALGTTLGGTELGVHVLINSDGNTSTGVYNGCGEPTLKPYEYYSDSTNRLADGNYGIYGPGGLIYSGPPNPPEEAISALSAHVISESFFMPTVGIVSGSGVPHVGISVAAFNGEDLSATDCVPSGIQEMYTDVPNIQ